MNLLKLLPSLTWSIFCCCVRVSSTHKTPFKQSEFLTDFRQKFGSVKHKESITPQCCTVGHCTSKKNTVQYRAVLVPVPHLMVVVQQFYSLTTSSYKGRYHAHVHSLCSTHNTPYKQSEFLTDFRQKFGSEKHKESITPPSTQSCVE